jgi:hypothetical protein
MNAMRSLLVMALLAPIVALASVREDANRQLFEALRAQDP